jgi:hypothetical protein
MKDALQMLSRQHSDSTRIKIQSKDGTTILARDGLSRPCSFIIMLLVITVIVPCPTTTTHRPMINYEWNHPLDSVSTKEIRRCVQDEYPK